MSDNRAIEVLKGCVVKEVLMDADNNEDLIFQPNDYIQFRTDKGVFNFSAEKNFYWISWIDHIRGLKFLINNAITDIKYYEVGESEIADGYQTLAIFQYMFTTNEGKCEIEMHNYTGRDYKGWLQEVEPPSKVNFKSVTKDFYRNNS